MSTDTTVPSIRGKHAPKHAPAKPKAKKGFFRRFWWVLIAAPVLLVLCVFGALVYAYTQIQLPKTLPPIQSTYLYDRNGTLLAQIHGPVDRTIIPLADIPKRTQDAVIAVEDHGFYSHPGIDPIAILRAAWTDLVKRQVVQGASTITEQLVKQQYAGSYVKQKDGSVSYIAPARTITEKIREALLAVKLEKTLSKEQILARYLNTIYFGHGAYGVQAAAQTYWSEDAKDLTTLQSATLAGLITAPSLFDPVLHPNDAKSRRDYALDQMVQYGYLDAAKAAQLKQKPVTTAPASDVLHAPVNSEYFVDYTKRYMIRRLGGAEVFGGGLRVTTSLDLSLQKAAEAAIKSRLPQPTDPQAALVAIDPRNGQILAMVGGRNFRRSQVNLATGQGGTGRQAGSSFKPFTLAAAMKAGYSLNAYWQGPSSITIPNPECFTNGAPWTLSNASDSEAGTFTLQRATWFSVNTVFAQVAAQVGPQNVADMAHAMGIRSPLKPVCSITLGTQAVTPLEMTNAYATLADRGIRHWADPLVQMTNRQGKVIGNVASTGARVLDQNNADLVTYALQGVISYGTGTAASIGRPAAGKTGTAQSYVDAWFCGYTPQLATCVWMGYPKGEIPMTSVEGVSPVFGGTIPAEIWHDFMAVAVAGQPVEGFPTPSFEGHTIGPLVPVSLPTTSPTPKPSSSPSTSPSPGPSPTPSPFPSPTTSPSPEPSPLPSPSAKSRR